MNIKEVIAHDEVFTIADDEEITPDLLSKYITKHKELITKRYQKLYNAYIGEYPIMHYDDKEKYKPDNRIVVNFAKYIVDTMNGFFIGIPIKINSKEDFINEYINFLDKYNDQDDNNAELSKICSIYGKGYELYYTDEAGEIAIVYLDPREGFMIYDESVIQNPRYFVNYYTDDDNVLHGYLFDNTRRYEFTDSERFELFEDNAHGFDGIPATEYIENEERMSIFESVYSQINEYNKAISEKANDVDYFADAYLKILGAKLDDDTQRNIRDNRIINFEGDGSDKLIVEFMDKPSSDTMQENLLNRLERLIFQNSMIANINDENFGTSSGIALKYKLLSMSNLAKTKERKFTSGMNRRYKIIFSNPVNKMKSSDWMNIEFKFTQNIPANTLEEAQIATQLTGIVSKEKQLEVLSIVENVKDEVDRMKEERDTSTYNTDYPTNRTVAEDI